MTNMLIATARSILKEVRFIAKETRINNVVSFPKIFRNLSKARRLAGRGFNVMMQVLHATTPETARMIRDERARDLARTSVVLAVSKGQGMSYFSLN